jgi:hypothetical protein
MRVLIDNYSSRTSTEPIYFEQTMKRVGIEAVVWNRNQISTYDVFDRVQPDLFITHYNHLDNDIIKYLFGSTKPLDLVLNVTGLDEEKSVALNQLLKDLKTKKVNVPFVFSNTPEGIPEARLKDFKTHSILPGADLFIPNHSGLDFEIDAARVYMSELDHDFNGEHDTYHNIEIGEKTEFSDFSATAVDMMPLYSKYKQVCFIGKPEDLVSQLLFDSKIRHGNVKLVSDNQERLDTILGGVCKTNLASPQDIKTRHTCLHRTKRLLSKLKVDFNQQALEQMIGSL